MLLVLASNTGAMDSECNSHRPNNCLNGFNTTLSQWVNFPSIISIRTHWFVTFDRLSKSVISKSSSFSGVVVVAVSEYSSNSLANQSILCSISTIDSVVG